MKPESDETLESILAYAETIPLDDVEAELTAAMSDPLLQDVVERAVALHGADLTAEQRADTREALLAYFATDARAPRLLEEIRSGGGKSHVVQAGSTGGQGVAGHRASRGQGRR
jgi:hypothetical protein